MKRCNQCGEDKPTSEFYKNAKKSDGLQTQCKLCQKLYHKGWYGINSDSHKKTVKIRRIKSHRENKIFVINYKLQHPCIDCGEADIRVLDFDHVRGTKRDNVSRMLSSGVSLKVLKEEISKCEVRCRNCHQKKTANERGISIAWVEEARQTLSGGNKELMLDEEVLASVFNIVEEVVVKKTPS